MGLRPVPRAGSSLVPTTSVQVDLVAVSIAGLNVWLGMNERDGWQGRVVGSACIYGWRCAVRIACVNMEACKSGSFSSVGRASVS